MDKKEKKHWFSQIARGDKTAFDAFFEYYYPKLIQFARIYINNQQQAEDVVADVLTNLLIHRERVFSLDHFEAYLYSSIKNKALSSLKRRHNTETSLDVEHQFLQISTSDPYQLLEQKEFNEFVIQIIENLPTKRKMVFQMIREEGLSYREVAELLDISERTVEVHLKLAVKDLRENIALYLDRTTMNRGSKKLLNILMPILLFNFLNY